MNISIIEQKAVSYKHCNTAYSIGVICNNYDGTKTREQLLLYAYINVARYWQKVKIDLNVGLIRPLSGFVHTLVALSQMCHQIYLAPNTGIGLLQHIL